MRKSGPVDGNRPARLVGHLHPAPDFDTADFLHRDTSRARGIRDGRPHCWSTVKASS